MTAYGGNSEKKKERIREKMVCEKYICSTEGSEFLNARLVKSKIMSAE